MITQLQQTLIDQKAQNGLFVSAFDTEKNLLFSQWSRSVPADEVLDMIHTHYIQDQTDTHTIILHIVTDVHHGSTQELRNIDLATTGIGIHDDEWNEGAILPHTTWIETPQEALSALKTQAQLHGKAHLVTFTVSDHIFSIS